MNAGSPYRSTGKRKTSVARVILRPGDGTTWFNGRTLEVFFPRLSRRVRCRRAAERGRARREYDVRVRVHGGGLSGQAGAVRHGIARALVDAVRAARGVEAGGLPRPRRRGGRAQEVGRHKAARLRSQQALARPVA